METMTAKEKILSLDPEILKVAANINNEWPIILPISNTVKGENFTTINTTQNLVFNNNAAINNQIGYGDLLTPIFQQKDLEKMVGQLEQVRNKEFSDYFGVTANLPPDTKMTLANIQKNLKSIEAQTGKRSVMIYVISLPDQLELLLVPSVGKITRYQVSEAKRELLQEAISEFRSQITNPRKRQTTSYLASAQLLYKWMIAPMEKDLKALGVNTLLLSLDPGLRSLPVAALHDGKHFLIEKYSFSLIPSFSLTNTRYGSVTDASVLAMGRSQFSEHAPLPAVPMELKTIASLRHGESFLNNNFTLNNLEKERSSKAFRIVHLATHAQFNSGNPSNSYIQLWDSKLTLDQVKTLNWNNPPVDLLVLSACNTALGDRDAELGFTGLAIQSGAKAVLGSLWSVSDEGTLGLMSEFYQKLRTSSIKADALREAQITMLSGKVKLHNGELITSQGAIPLPPNLPLNGNINLTHPYYWSGFTLVGNPW
jgi:CHAT domain-containing protein